MKTLKLADFLDVIKGEMLQGDPDEEIRKLVKKTANIGEHCLYFHTSKKAIKPEAIAGISKFTIVTEDSRILSMISKTANVILTANAKDSYWRFIDYYRSQFQIPVIGVTGTCGKTTTKDMIKHILNRRMKVHSTLYSQNGLHLNLPYLMGLTEKTEAAVFEMGVAYPGNIRISGKYFKPTVGIITNIGEAHLEGCRTLENYIKAKGEMLEVLSEDGILIINTDDENIKRLPIAMYKGSVLSFGKDETADYRACDIQFENDRMSYSLQVQNSEYKVTIPGVGEHNVYNSLAAIAATAALGIPIEEAARRLSTFRTMERHAKLYHGAGNLTVIDDTWSCNPSSVKSGLDVLKKTSNGRTEVLVLGRMQRLGNQERKQHIQMGQTIFDIGGVDHLITVGSSARLTGERAITLGMDPARVHFVMNAAELEAKLAEIFHDDMTILFKMSLGKMDPSFRKVVEKYRFA
ncbi:UDP-N-acetylmuramoyl-tripeptide--D-alanyl-D-alanine ligase [Neobacillus kokaensis]|uniref:UDP-N-acetylmuramoyl-tripeptide--D-alanyl-D-alanine ligase n=1 Tax=Neobacillus kokaensis TaxID=2759023 RepID=A0ABQ3N689_9BACI|nr:UDP-N-acetylmuramoyl-tripeptide--D-alanyl-D-alanine ligase [Neobacillus kokaensis]GHH99561.1 UDP-N-acetylmuramoyl-tripeptide--D-alanyl-D-alanine ligase [Neobacillus kokaensis]